MAKYGLKLLDEIIWCVEIGQHNLIKYVEDGKVIKCLIIMKEEVLQCHLMNMKIGIVVEN